MLFATCTMQRRKASRCATPCGREIRMRTTARGALVLLGQISARASVLRTLGATTGFVFTSRINHFSHLAQLVRAPQRPPAAALLARRGSRRQIDRLLAVCDASRRDPRSKNDEHLLPLAGRQPGPKAGRDQPRGEPADHNTLSKTRAPRGPGPSGRARAGELAATSRARPPTKPETTHPS